MRTLVGHGSPHAWRAFRALLPWCWAVVWAVWSMAVAGNADAAPQAAPGSEEVSLQLRVAWGGGGSRRWNGTIALTAGTIELHRTLGLEADEPGSMWIDEGLLLIRERSPRAYDGVDFFVQAPLSARLIVRLAAAEGTEETPPVEIQLADVLNKPHNVPLDRQNNRLLIRRSPGDHLRLRFDRDHLVFSPGEKFTVSVKPTALPVGDQSSLKLKGRLVSKTSADVLWSTEQTVQKSGELYQPETVPLEIKLPETEGVYDLFLEATERGPLRWSKPVATRQVQLVVVSDLPTRKGEIDAPWSRIMEIDPTHAGWADRLKTIPLLPGSRLGPLGSGNSQIISHPLGQLLSLQSAGPGQAPAWEAYPLAITKPGSPHLLEIDLPSNLPQTLGISIVEPNAAGAVMPIGLDSGCYALDEDAAEAPEWRRHRLLFWPRTRNPYVLLSNRREQGASAYGKLRVLAGPARLPRSLENGPQIRQRMLAGYLDRPLFAENFSAPEALDSLSGRSLDDWQTFRDGGERLAEYLAHVGYNGLMIAVLADGSTIYPSSLIDPTPRYDTGAFFDAGLDPFRKDGLELLLRIFDRERLKLIPALQFSSPLPALEVQVRATEPAVEGILLIGDDGRPWHERHAPRRGLGSYYNPLHPTVQRAMLDVARELTERYGRHPSFAGLALDLSSEGYARLPGEAWGLDDTTIAQFEQDTGLKTPGEGSNRFSERANFLLGSNRKTWLQWRAAKLADFYRRLRSELTSARDDGELYLVGTGLFDTPDAQRQLAPSLGGRARIADVLLAFGIQVETLRGENGPAFIRPHRFTVPGPLTARAVEWELERSAELDALASGSQPAGSLFFHQPEKTRLTSFEAKSPFGKDKTYLWMVSQFSRSGPANRQRFVHSLARLDSSALFDGGWMLPLGQEESLMELFAAYRRLPAGRFQPIEGVSDPVVVRTLVREKSTYAYMVNDSPWPVQATLDLESPRGIQPEELSGWRRLSPPRNGRWVVELAPFDLVAVRFPSAAVRLSNPQVQTAPGVRSTLASRIEDLRNRRAVLQNPPPLAAPSNPGFEEGGVGGAPSGWELAAVRAEEAVLQIDSHQPYAGSRAILLGSRGGGVTLRSAPFAATQTGRLALSVWLRVEDPARQPTLRLAIEGVLDGEEYYRFAPVGAGEQVDRVRSEWSQYVLQIDDLPVAGLSQLRARFDLLGAGEVWLDQVELFDLAFSQAERIALDKNLALAESLWQQSRFGRCWRELEGYWPKYLAANVPLSPAAAAVATPPEPRRSEPAEKQATRPGVLERVRDWWRF